jgi:hypothetical protein
MAWSWRDRATMISSPSNTSARMIEPDKVSPFRKAFRPPLSKFQRSREMADRFCATFLRASSRAASSMRSRSCNTVRPETTENISSVAATTENNICLLSVFFCRNRMDEWRA